MIEAGANVNEVNNEGLTAFIQSAMNGHVNTLRVLLAAGAEINAKDNYGYDALSYAMSRGKTEAVKFLRQAMKNKERS